MSATAASNQPISITTRSAIAARVAQAPSTATTRPTVVSRLRASWTAWRRQTKFLVLSTSARNEFADTPGLRRSSAQAPMRSGLDTFMR